MKTEKLITSLSPFKLYMGERKVMIGLIIEFLNYIASKALITFEVVCLIRRNNFL